MESKLHCCFDEPVLNKGRTGGKPDNKAIGSVIITRDTLDKTDEASPSLMIPAYTSAPTSTLADNRITEDGARRVKWVRGTSSTVPRGNSLAF
jgi:hypothetical protein